MKTENFALAVKVKTTWVFEEVTRIKVFPNISANKSTCGIIFRVLRITFFTPTFEEHPVWNINLLCEIRLALITAQLCFRYCKVTSSWHKIIPRTYCLSFHMIILCPYPKIIPDYVRRPSVIHTRCTINIRVDLLRAACWSGHALICNFWSVSKSPCREVQQALYGDK